MGPSGFVGNYWIDTTAYETVLSSLLSPPLGDPETILVTGILTEAGQFTFGPSVNLTSGTLTPSTSGGNVTVSSLDSSGNIVNSVSFYPNYGAIVAYQNDSSTSPSLIDLGAMSVVLELPAASSVAQLAVSQNGKVLQKISLNSQLLEGIISRIPDNAFKPPRQRDHDFHAEANNDYIDKDRRILTDLVNKIQFKLNDSDFKPFEKRVF